ncbi:GNAT family N-acetyltransferase [Oerskovia turbata]
MTTVRDLRRSEHRAAATLLADAFATDPLFLDVFGDSRSDPAARRRALRLTSWMIGANRLLAGRRLAVADDQGLVAVAVVELPHGPVRRFTGAVLAAARYLPVATSLPRAATGRLNRYGREARALAPASPHHYLAMVGVLPRAQGTGLGSALLDSVARLAEADPRSAGIGLDTENEANLRFYARHGFEPRGSFDVGTFTTHALFRPRES